MEEWAHYPIKGQMITNAKKTILKGKKVNSMYMPDTVVCEASPEEMEAIYQKINRVKAKADPSDIIKMNAYDTDSDDLFEVRPLLIEK